MWEQPEYDDPHYVRARAAARRDHYCTDPNWRTMQPGGPHRLLGWQSLTRYGSRSSYRDVCELVAGEEELNGGRFKLFQYELCEHVVELKPNQHEAFVVTEWQAELDHRGRVFDWVAANVRHAWNFHCYLEAYKQLDVFFSFDDPQEAMLFKLTWG